MADMYPRPTTPALIDVIRRVIAELKQEARHAKADKDASGIGGSLERDPMYTFAVGWEHGAAGTLPAEYTDRIGKTREKLRLEADPEYQQYVRLHEKFGKR